MSVDVRVWPTVSYNNIWRLRDKAGLSSANASISPWPDRLTNRLYYSRHVCDKGPRGAKAGPAAAAEEDLVVCVFMRDHNSLCCLSVGTEELRDLDMFASAWRNLKKDPPHHFLFPFLGFSSAWAGTSSYSGN